MDQRPTVLFDEDCFLCRNLAAWLGQLPGGPWQLLSWQQHTDSQQPSQNPEQLQIWFGGQQYLKGDEAWQYLVENVPALQPIRWIGQQMGWERGPARILNKTGSFLRRVCRSCPGKK